MKNKYDPLDWRFVLNIYGRPQIFRFEPGFIYRLRAKMRPGSRLRLVGRDNVGFAAAHATGEYACSFSFTADKDMENTLIQYVGKIGDISFEIEGIDREIFK